MEKRSAIDQLAEDMKKKIGRVYTDREFGEIFVGPKCPKPWGHFITQITRDSIKHFVDGIGDLNILYRDREYAKRTKYGCLIAPPNFLRCVRDAQPPEAVPSGVSGFYAGSEWEWFRPICEGDEFTWRTNSPSDVQLKPSKFAGKLLISYEKTELIRQGGEVVGMYKSWVIWTERKKAVEMGSYADIAKMPEYTVEDINKIYTAQDKEVIRGATPRYWEDVEVGEELLPVVRGPYTLIEEIAWTVGKGCPMTMSDRLYRLLIEHDPGLAKYYDPTLKIYLNSVTAHYNSDLARKGGVPRFFDAGAQREAWCGMVFTNWMGNDGCVP